MTVNHAVQTLSRTKRLWIVALMVLSCVLFVAGVVVERSSGNGSAPTLASQSTVATALPEGSAAKEAQEGQAAATALPEGSAAREAQEGQTAAPQTNGEGSPVREAAEQNRVFGIDVEAPWFIASVVIGTLLLIAALFVLGYRALLLVLLVSLVAALFDGREVVYQLGQAHYGIAVLALGVVVSRLATALVAWRARREGQHSAPPPMTSSSSVVS
jgi:hypothetical protein